MRGRVFYSGLRETYCRATVQWRRLGQHASFHKDAHTLRGRLASSSPPLAAGAVAFRCASAHGLSGPGAHPLLTPPGPPAGPVHLRSGPRPTVLAFCAQVVPHSSLRF
jgi:hypothetical protein